MISPTPDPQSGWPEYSFLSASSPLTCPAWVEVKEKFTLEQATEFQRGSTGLPVLFLYLGVRWRWVINATPRPL